MTALDIFATTTVIFALSTAFFVAYSMHAHRNWVKADDAYRSHCETVKRRCDELIQTRNMLDSQAKTNLELCDKLEALNNKLVQKADPPSF
jgi:hypothetical protein